MYITEMTSKSASLHHDKRYGIALSAILLLLCLLFPLALQAQSIPANPSFEITDSGDNNFAGWNQFGQTGSSTQAVHGSLAAKVSGQNSGDLNVSGYWQLLEGEPGEQWQVSGHVLNPSSAPLSGGSFALVNVEWRSSTNVLIGYDTFTVANAASTVDEYLAFSFLSSPAPAGTAAIHFLLGVLQNAGDPAPDVLYDQVNCYSTTYPTIDDMQWTDFPGGTTLEFSDRIWRVKGPGWYGPGNNYFSNLPQSVWVDAEDRLHLTIKQISNVWNSTEVTLSDALGYGDYIFTTLSALDQLDIRAVLGLFLWQYGPSGTPPGSWWNPYNEIDVEYGRWGNAGNQIGQFVAQPWDWTGNMFRYDATFGAQQLSSHAFNWLPDRVEFRSWYGGPEDESPANMISAWTYYGPHVPLPEQPRVHLNLWYIATPLAADQEVIIDEFTFIPTGTQIPEIPQNLVITVNEPDVLLNWNDDPDVTYWTVWSSDNPATGFLLRDTVTTNSCALTGEASLYPHRFYYVIANN